MATQGSNKSAADSEDYETKTLNTKSMEILVTAFSKAIENTMTVGSPPHLPQQPPPSTPNTQGQKPRSTLPPSTHTTISRLELTPKK